MKVVAKVQKVLDFEGVKKIFNQDIDAKFVYKVKFGTNFVSWNYKP